MTASDKDAKIQIDLTTHRVQIEPTKARAAELGDAIREAGYTPVEVSAGTAEAPPAGEKGGC